jgi:hypothetical protein
MIQCGNNMNFLQAINKPRYIGAYLSKKNLPSYSNENDLAFIVDTGEQLIFSSGNWITYGSIPEVKNSLAVELDYLREENTRLKKIIKGMSEDVLCFL